MLFCALHSALNECSSSYLFPNIHANHVSYYYKLQAAETYAFDEEMAARLRKANPQAFGNIVKRMLEAAGRGMWNADEQKLEQLRSMYADIDSQIEGV
jgi:cobalamin biosynthesis Mg chelatase CobN